MKGKNINQLGMASQRFVATGILAVQPVADGRVVSMLDCYVGVSHSNMASYLC